MLETDASLVRSLYVDHHGWLVQWLRRRTGNADQAADIAQDTFVRVLLKKAVETLDEPRAYLTVIAKGLVANAGRKAAVERAYLDTLALLPEAQSPSPEDRAIQLEALFEIDRMLGQLAPQVRTAFLLAQLDGLTYAQIAEQLGISLRTVKRHMQQGFEQCLMATLS
ncbi:sigma-70 family RNA polymerase sigma factor [Variovorax sp. GB1P17]|uniref:sigma-70 family RNA polymerase sigma factor n=1 Tax=Variovorax sp. GB1P17 TaxID=3443740 RepID=UPI003F463361